MTFSIVAYDPKWQEWGVAVESKFLAVGAASGGRGEFDEATRKALRALAGAENLEERWDGTGDMIDKVAVDFLMERFGDE